ncbi:MAG: CHAD domain-containing protein, partial [Candidatus Kapaibacterium sp.]
LHKTAYSGQLIRMLKDNLKAFGTLRDLQVMLEHLGEIRHQAHELNYFYHYLLKKEEKLIKSAIAKLDDIDLSEFESVLFFIKNNIRHNAASVDFSINRLIEVIDESFNKVMNRVSQVDYNKTTTIHKVRIAFKKFRYMIESAAPLIGLGKQQLKELSEFQSLLGAIQDSEVYTAELTDFITIQEEIPKKAFTDSLRLAEEHKNLVLNRYRANAGKLTKFWH